MATMWKPQPRATAVASVAPGRAGALALFADDFGAAKRAAAPIPAVEATEPPAVITPADVQTAYTDGVRAGAASAEAAAARQTEAILQALMLELASVRAGSQQATEAAATEVTGLLLAILQRFFPVLAARFGPAEAVAASRTILAGLHNEPEVVIRASAATVQALERAFGTPQPEAPIGITLVVADTMTPGDLAVSWHHGGATRNADRLWAELVAILDLHGLRAPQTLDAPPLTQDMSNKEQTHG